MAKGLNASFLFRVAACPVHNMGYMCVCVPNIYPKYAVHICIYTHVYIYSIYTVLPVLMDKHLFNNMTPGTLVCSENW